MTASITIGLWVVPLFVTIFALFAAYRSFGDEGTYGAGQIVNLIYLGLAVIVSLIAWLIWAVLT
jgi:hypothetical protein